MPRFSAISEAKLGLALPVKTMKSDRGVDMMKLFEIPDQ
jgi:hypothetical protein